MLIFGIMSIQLLILFVAANSVFIVCDTIMNSGSPMNNGNSSAPASNDEPSAPAVLSNDNSLRAEYYDQQIKILQQEIATKDNIFSANVLRMITTYEAMIETMDQGMRIHEQRIERLRQDSSQDEIQIQEKITKINQLIASVRQSRETAIRNIELLLEKDGEDRRKELARQADLI